MLAVHELCWLIGAFIAAWGASLIGRTGGDVVRRIRRQEGAIAPRLVPASRGRRTLPTPLALALGLLIQLAAAGAIALGLWVQTWSYDEGIFQGSVFTAVLVGVGAFGVALTAWALVGIPAPFRRCLGCLYDMRRTGGLRCPECGRDAKDERELIARRRRPRSAAAGVALAALCIGVLPFLPDPRLGALAFLPTRVLVAVFPAIPDHWISGHPDSLYQRAAGGGLSSGSKEAISTAILAELFDADRPQRQLACLDFLTHVEHTDPRINRKLFTLSASPVFQTSIRAAVLLSVRAQSGLLRMTAEEANQLRQTPSFGASPAHFIAGFQTGLTSLEQAELLVAALN